jgi:plastocyanin
MNRRRFLLAGACTMVGATGCTERSCGPHDGFDIGMGSSFYCPETVRISTGETVQWRNTGARAHTVTAYGGTIPDGAAYFASGGFDSEEAARDAWFESGNDNGRLVSGDTFTHRFEVPGQYDYFCVPHEQQGMVGSVVVEE